MIHVIPTMQLNNIDVFTFYVSKYVTNNDKSLSFLCSIIHVIVLGDPIFVLWFVICFYEDFYILVLVYVWPCWRVVYVDGHCICVDKFANLIYINILKATVKLD